MDWPFHPFGSKGKPAGRTVSADNNKVELAWAGKLSLSCYKGVAMTSLSFTCGPTYWTNI
jgi:hypothetical protein